MIRIPIKESGDEFVSLSLSNTMQRVIGVFAVLACLFLGTINGSAFLLESNCGKSQRSDNYGMIGGGETTGIFSNPWMVLIIAGGIPTCGGSLITSRKYLILKSNLI